MGIQSFTLSAGATLSPTGGTPFTLTLDGVEIQNGIHVSDAAVADFKTRPGCSFKVRMPSKRADGTWQKGKMSMVFTRPKVLASGVVDYPLVRIDHELTAESTDAEMTALLNQAAQLLVSASTQSFLKTGSKA